MTGAGVMLAWLTVTPEAYHRGEVTGLRCAGALEANADAASLGLLLSVLLKVQNSHLQRASNDGYCLLKYTAGRCPKKVEEDVFVLRPGVLYALDDEGTVWAH
jgi:hypothetical protein